MADSCQKEEQKRTESRSQKGIRITLLGRDTDYNVTGSVTGGQLPVRLFAQMCRLYKKPAALFRTFCDALLRNKFFFCATIFLEFRPELSF